MKTIKHSKIAILLIIFSTITFSSCRSKMIGVKNIATEREVSGLLDNVPNFKTFRSQIQIETSGLNAKGDLRIIRNKAIYLSVQAFLGIEVARLKITPDSLIAIDRLHRRYFADTFKHIYGLRNQGINFFTIQGLLANTLFIQGKDSLSLRDVDAFRWEKKGSETEIIAKSEESTRFTLNKDFQIETSSIGRDSDRMSMKWIYSEFTPVERRVLPLRSEVSVASSKKNVSASLQYGKIEIDKQFQVDVQIPIRYSRVDLNEVLKIFSEL